MLSTHQTSSDKQWVEFDGFPWDSCLNHNASKPYGDRSCFLSVRESVKATTLSHETTRNNLPRSSIDPSQEIPVKLDGQDVFQTYEDKPANSILRWNLLWLVLVLVAPYPLWLTFIDCQLSYQITIFVNMLLTVNYVYAAFLCWRYMWRMIRSFNTPYWQELDPTLRERVSHMVIMPTYKEPVELLLETISSIAGQSVASSIVLVVGMEEKTPHQEEKKRIIREQFRDSFKALVFSVHPHGVKGEIPGACSNRNFAARFAVQHMIDEKILPVDPLYNEIDLDFTTVTVCDADTTFFHRYFENLTWSFLNEAPETRFKVCWQSPLFYNIALDERWFFTRVMGILRSFFMVGFLIGCSINTMSIYSLSLRLLVEGRFFHPGYQMDDIIYTLSAMKATGQRIRIRTLDIPTLSGPTSGETAYEEFKEWCVQANRWTIGAAEVFHYFFVKLIKRNYFLPGLEYFWWFVYYYGFVLCVAGLIQISNMVVQMVSLVLPEIGVSQCKPMQGLLGLPDEFQYDWIFPAFLLFAYFVVFLTAFCMDALVSQILALRERIGIWRNFGHFLSTQLVLWVYCLVEYKAILTIALFGKQVCGHKASEKHALVRVPKQRRKKNDVIGETDHSSSTNEGSSCDNSNV